MGVAGSGKTTVGRLLAGQIGADFGDGDDLHTEAARAKMRRRALSDDDRWPWLDRIAAELAPSRGPPRDDSRLLGAAKSLSRPVARRRRSGAAVRLSGGDAGGDARPGRQSARTLHAGSAGDSQFATLEPPSGEADVIESPRIRISRDRHSAIERRDQCAKRAMGERQP